MKGWQNNCGCVIERKILYDAVCVCVLSLNPVIITDDIFLSQMVP